MTTEINKTLNSEAGVKRLEFPLQQWNTLPGEQKEAYFKQVNHEIEEVGIVSIAGALTEGQCDNYRDLLQHELDHPTQIERVMHQRRGTRDGWKVYNLPSRHPDFLELIAHPFTVEYMRRQLGPTMELHSSEGAITPPAGGNLPPGTSDPASGWHVDVVERIPSYFLGFISIYYLCDTDAHNGATRYIPGTHKSFISLEEALLREPRLCPVRKGDVVLFNPYLWHAASPNSSNENRPVIINYYQRGFIKQGFDYPATMSVAERKRLTPLQRQLLGFNRRVPRDIDEIYLMRGEVAEFDPIGKLD